MRSAFFLFLWGFAFFLISSSTAFAGSCPSYGWYCGGSVGQNSSYLYYCSGSGANPSLSNACSYGCEVKPPGYPDVCKSAPSGPCPSGGDYCGSSVGQDSRYLYYCSGSGAYPTLKQQCSNGCEIKPPGTPDVCKPAAPSGPCPGAGDYCGGSVGQNSNNLYYCSGSGANPTLKQTCSSNGCQTNPSGVADVCKPSGPCPSAGDYCGGSVGQNSNNLYYCSGAGANPTLKQTCSVNGCQTNPPGTADVCKPSGACPSSGDYCGGSVGQDSTKLYSCTGAGANPTLKQACTNGCEVKPPGTPDVCKASPNGMCPTAGDYCGDSVGQNANNLYNCTASGAIPTLKQTCSANGCQINPPGTPDVCKPSGGACPSAGDYCGGSVGQNSNHLYNCTGAGAVPTLKQACSSNGCEVKPPGTPDVCKPSGTCPGGGLYCGGSVGQNTNNLYRCSGGGATPTLEQACSNGCQVNPPGTADVCKTSTTCPTAGDYCGSSVGQNPNNLYHCTAEGSSPTLKQSCSLGCHINPPGTPDVCSGTGSITCPSGNGYYCGGPVGLNPSTLYQCTNGNYQVAQACSNGCQINPSGIADQCSAISSGGAVSGPNSVDNSSISSTLSHIYWPFENSSFSNQSPWVKTGGSGGGKHFDSDYYAQDWAASGGNDATCNKNFLSPVSGKVIFAGCIDNASNCNTVDYGKQVIVQLDGNPNFAMRIAHLNSVDVAVGNNVTTGRKLGTVGNTGAGGPFNCHAHVVLYKELDKVYANNETALNRLKNGRGLGLDGNSYANKFAANFVLDVEPGSFVFPLQNVNDYKVEMGFRYGSGPVNYWKNCDGGGSANNSNKKFHGGLDLIKKDSKGTEEVFNSSDSEACKRGAFGARVYAIGNGEIIEANPNTGEGGRVTIKHRVGGKDIYSTYMHINLDLSAVPNYPNSKSITAGTSIGTVGNFSNNPHLHFEMKSFPEWKGGYTVSSNPTEEGYINPCDFINKHGGAAVPSSCTNINPNGGKITSLDSNLSIEFPANAVNQDLMVNTFISDGTASGNYTYLNNPYQVTALNIAGNEITQFNRDITLELSYNPDLLLGRSEDSLSLAYFNTGTNQWVKIPSFVDKVKKTIRALTNHFSEYVVLTDEQIPNSSPISGTELLPSPWHIVGNNGSSELYHHDMDPDGLKGKDTLRITYDLHGINAIGGDASAIIFDQNGWEFISLANYGQNGKDGPQTVDIPLSHFVGLDLNADVGTLHTRFWYGSAYTVDVTSIIAYNSQSGTPTPTVTPVPTTTPTPVPTTTVTPTPTPVPTVSPTDGGTELLLQPWHLSGNGSAAELYQQISSSALQGKSFLRITYDLHGINAIGGDASAIIFDQNGWQFVSLANYGQNGKNGVQTVDIPLSDFSGLNPNSSVGTLHTRFWYGTPYTVDITSIKAFGPQTSPTPTTTPTPTPVPVVAPVVTLSGNPTTISSGASSTLTWSTTGTAPACTKSGGWTGGIATSGNQSVSPTSNTTYTISCTNSAGTNSKSVTITVNTPTPVPTAEAKPIPGKIEAESYNTMSGIQTEPTSDSGGGINVGWMDTGDWLDYNVNVTTSGNYTVQFRVASGTGGSSNGIQLRKADGTVLTTASVPNTGGWQNWSTVTSTVNLSAGTQTLRVHVNNGGWNLNWINFATATTTPVPTATATPVPTATPSAEGTELLTAPWHLVGNNGSVEKYQGISSSALQGKTKLRITYDLHGLNALGGDASAIIFDQNGWQFVSLSNYGQNGKNGIQTVDIPLSAFTGLNPNASVGTLHTRFWYGGAYTVDITSIKAI